METFKSRGWLSSAAEIIATVGYLGYFPIASGTVGSLPAILVGYWLSENRAWFLILIILMCFLATLVSTKAEIIFGRKDPREIVIDEFTGMLVALFWLPPVWHVLLSAFLLFRLFDIFKPFPAHRLEFLPGGLGIVADDMVAGIYANLTVQILLLFFSRFNV